MSSKKEQVVPAPAETVDPSLVEVEGGEEVKGLPETAAVRLFAKPGTTLWDPVRGRRVTAEGALYDVATEVDAWVEAQIAAGLLVLED